MHLNHYENPYSRLAQHMNCAGANLVHCPGYADDLRPIHTLNRNLLLTQCALSAKLTCFALFPAAVSLQASLRSSSQRLSILAASLGSAQTDLILRQFLLRHLAVKRQTHDQYQYLRFVHFLISGTLPETYTFSH